MNNPYANKCLMSTIETQKECPVNIVVIHLVDFSHVFGQLVLELLGFYEDRSRVLL